MTFFRLNRLFLYLQKYALNIEVYNAEGLSKLKEIKKIRKARWIN